MRPPGGDTGKRGVLTIFLLTLLSIPRPGLSTSPEPASPAVDIPTLEEIVAIDDDMRRFLDEHVPQSKSPQDRIDALLDALVRPQGIGLEYDNRSRATRTARETFYAGNGNCISFTNLFVALVRELGFHAYFSEVDDVLDQEQRGEVILNNKHMFATVEIENGHYEVDFGRPAGSYRFVRRISDQRAAAHFYNNRGAERLVEADPQGALAYLNEAVEVAPELAAAWINKGVAHRKLGEPELAEEAYRKALSLDGSALAAALNLGYLYGELGRAEDAERFFGRVKSYRNRSPYHHFTLGTRAVQEGDLDEAVRRFKQAIRRAPREAELFFALGDAYYRLGEMDQALENMQRALRLAGSEEKREHYARVVETLEKLRQQ